MFKCFIAGMAMVAFCASAVRATPVDPQGVFDTYVRGTPITPETDFGFGSDALGGGIFSFQNVSGHAWTAMNFFVTEPQGISIECGPGPFFVVCGVSSTNLPDNLALYEITFSEPLNGGIANQQIFSLNMNNPLPSGGQNFDPNGAGGWGADADFTVVPKAAPEPVAGLLTLGGFALLAGLGALRRRA